MTTMWLMSPKAICWLAAWTDVMAGPVARTVSEPTANVSMRRRDRDISASSKNPGVPTSWVRLPRVYSGLHERQAMGWLWLREVLLEPADDALDPVDAAVRPADGQHEVRLGRVADHLDLATERAQDVEDHLGVARRAAHVVLGLQQEERRVVLVHARGGRAGEPRLDVVPGVLDVHRAPAEHPPEVGGGPLDEHVGHGVLAHRGLEHARVIGEHPVGEEAAVRETHDADLLSISDSFLDRPLDDGQQVAAVGLAPAALKRLRVVLAVAGRAARVGPDDVEARVGQGDHLEPRRGTEGGVGAAVDVDHQRRLLAFVVRGEQPGFDVVAFGVGDAEALGGALEGAEPAAATFSELAQFAAFDGIDV